MSLLVPDYDSMAAARKSLSAVLDSAERGRAVTIRRFSKTAAVVPAAQLRNYFAATLPANAEVFHEAGQWVVLLENRPFASEGATVDEAIDDLVLSLREYAEDWDERLHDAPNHRDNWALVQLVRLSTDAELREWISGENE